MKRERSNRSEIAHSPHNLGTCERKLELNSPGAASAGALLGLGIDAPDLQGTVASEASRIGSDRRALMDKEAALAVAWQELEDLTAARVHAEDQLQDRIAAVEGREKAILERLQECTAAEAAVDDSQVL